MHALDCNDSMESHFTATLKEKCKHIACCYALDAWGNQPSTSVYHLEGSKNVGLCVRTHPPWAFPMDNLAGKTIVRVHLSSKHHHPSMFGSTPSATNDLVQTVKGTPQNPSTQAIRMTSMNNLSTSIHTCTCSNCILPMHLVLQ